MTQIIDPYPQFKDDDGSPLDNGQIYVGVSGLNPRANPVQVYYDEARTVTALQPIRTLGGRPAYQGAPTRLYIAEVEYSIEVLNRFGTPVTGPTSGAVMTASDVPFTAPQTGAVPRSGQSKLSDVLSVKDFGAVGDGTTNDTTAITAADAIAAKKYSPAGTYDITLPAVDLDGPYFGEGQIRDSANNKRAPWFSAIKAAPSSAGNGDSPETAFNGDLSKNQIAMEHRITGVATVGQPTTGYTYTPEAFPIYGYLYNESGWNNATATNVGRTGVAFQRVRVFQAGQGDAVCYNASAFVNSTKAGSTDFLANPAAVLVNGDITAGIAGAYLNAGEFALLDNGFDAAGIGWVVNLYRTVATGAKGVFWAGFQAQSQGTQPANHAFGVQGLFNVGLDGTTATLGANNALISGKAGQRIYLNNASSNGRYTTSYNGDYIEYSSGVGGLNFVIGGTSVVQMTPDRVTMLQPPRLPTATVATLPAATGRAGMEYYVSDSNANTRLAIVAGGGSTFIKVFSNGTNWLIQ